MTSLVQGPSHRTGRAALLVAALLLLALAFAPRAGAFVYWANDADVTSTTIGRANLDGTGVNQSFIDGANQPCGVAADGAHLYWANIDGSIGRANLDGTGVNQSFIAGAAGNNPCGVAVDGTHLYWTNVDGGTIGRANLDGSGVNQAFIGGASGPCGVAVDGTHLYWANIDGGTIGRANLDGSGMNQGFVGGASLPCGVAVDAAHLYWANLGGTTIGRANLDGTGVNQGFVGGASAPCGVAVDAAHVYWANIDGIGRANLDGTGVNQGFVGASGPCGVAVDAGTQAAQPSNITVNDVSMAEGNGGNTAFNFTVSLSAPQANPVTVNFATANGTAAAPGDYASNSGTLTFAPGVTTQPVTVQVNGDTAVEPNESFNLNLSNATGNAAITGAQGVGTIQNDDQAAAPREFTLGRARLNPKTGTARLAVTVPGPGELAISGTGAKAAGPLVARSVSAAGTLQLLVKASGPKQRTLNRTGRVSVKPTVTYTPIGGTPSTRSTNIRLKKL
jgi:hypothetical protein